MASKPKSRPVSFPDLEPLTDLLRTPPSNPEERLMHIRALGQRIEGYIEFMCGVNTLNGTSAESKQKAVALFYERLVILEKTLSEIHRATRRRVRPPAKVPVRMRSR